MVVVCVTAVCTPAAAQQALPSPEKTVHHPATRTFAFLGGAATALGIHEAAHVVFDLAFDAQPGLTPVHFGPFPFFAITHAPVSRRREFVISSAGFWVQQAGNEWLLTARPRLRDERAPFAKGFLAFNILASAAYAGAAFARTGPAERDTRGMALTLGPGGVDERWVGALVLAPAALDAYRYFAPDSRWAAWTSRAIKVGMVLLVVR